MGKLYKVLTTQLQKIDHALGIWEAGHPAAGTPKKIDTVYKGDVVEFHPNDEYRIPELVQAGAITEASDDDVQAAQDSSSEKGGGQTPPASSQAPSQNTEQESKGPQQ